MKEFILKDYLQKYQPFCPAEQKSKDFMMLFLKQNSNSFSRKNTNGHFTASAFLLDKKKENALLMKHKKLGLWLQLGGHCDEDENTLRVAIKEAQEESGLTHIVPVLKDIFDIDVHKIAPTATEKAHLHLDVRFLLKLEGEEKIAKNHESLDLKWFGKFAPLPTKETSVVRLFEKWRIYE